jgi:hypothetical protein
MARRAKKSTTGVKRTKSGKPKGIKARTRVRVAKKKKWAW